MGERFGEFRAYLKAHPEHMIDVDPVKYYENEQMSKLFAIIFTIFITSIGAIRHHCPFKWANSTRKVCERSDEFRAFLEADYIRLLYAKISDEFRSFLESHPELRNQRPDIDRGTKDGYETEQMKYCCFGSHTQKQPNLMIYCCYETNWPKDKGQTNRIPPQSWIRQFFPFPTLQSFNFQI